MYKINRLYAASRGVPGFFGVAWWPAVLRNIERRDPFSHNIRSLPTWMPAESTQAGQEAEVYCQIDLDTDGLWTDARQILDARSAALHDGHVFELWSLIIGEPAARAAWKPAWISGDARVQLLEFPEQATKWLADSDALAIADVADRWQDLPYLASAAEQDASAIAMKFLHLLQPMARVALERGGCVFIEGSEYALP